MLNILCLVTDAYGGTGGVALFGRDVIEAMCADTKIDRVVCLPRVIAAPLQPMPDKLSFDVSAAGGVFNYLKAVMKHVCGGTKFDLVYCTHINLVPVARIAAAVAGVPWVLCLHGVESWQPPARRLTRLWARKASYVHAVSGVTLGRFREWCPVPAERCAVIPNAVHLEQYQMMPKDQGLLDRHGLDGRKVIMTLGRLDPTEQAKGFDHVIKALPDLQKSVPNLSYLIVGTGDDKRRLEALAAAAGVSDSVVFAGFVSEDDKPKYYCMADAYVMPSKLEGFGFAFIEALACGLPTVASTIDGGRDAVRQGQLGWLVDPLDQAQIKSAILEALAQPKAIQPGVDYFSYENFVQRVQHAVHTAISNT